MLPTFLMEGPLVWPGQHARIPGAAARSLASQAGSEPTGIRSSRDLTLPAGLSVERLDRRKSLSTTSARGSTGRGARAADRKDPFADQIEPRLLRCCSPARSRAPSTSATKIPSFAIDTAGTCTGNRSCLPGGWSRPACRSCRSTWAAFRRGTRTPPISNRSRIGCCPRPTRAYRPCSMTCEARGLLDETLVVVTGEFGRTPRIGSSTGNANTRDGRDHWAAVFSAVFAGAGVRGGQTIGQSDKHRRLSGQPPLHAGRPGRDDLPSARHRPGHSSCATGWSVRSGSAPARQSRRSYSASASST